MSAGGATKTSSARVGSRSGAVVGARDVPPWPGWCAPSGGVGTVFSAMLPPALVWRPRRQFARLDGDPARAGVLGALRPDDEQPVAVLRRHLVGIHLSRQL